MATDSIRNALAGEIRGNQVSLTTLRGDIVNDRTAIAVGEGSGMRTLVDDGGSISARDTLSIKSGRDLTNSSAISSGGDASLSATRDLNLLRGSLKAGIYSLKFPGQTPVRIEFK